MISVHLRPLTVTFFEDDYGPEGFQIDKRPEDRVGTAMGFLGDQADTGIGVPFFAGMFGENAINPNGVSVEVGVD